MKTGKNKKIMGAVLAAAILASSVLPVYAADGSQSGTMKLTVSKEAGYILTIPSDQNIVFGTVDTGIGEVSVSGEIGTQQAVQVSAVSTEFVDAEDAGNSISFELREGNAAFTQKKWGSQALKDAASKASLTVHIPSETWGATGPGTYHASITFTAELVDAE